MRFQSRYISTRLGQSHQGVLTAWSVVAAFTTYFCMYAFRKPFTVAQHEDLLFWLASIISPLSIAGPLFVIRYFYLRQAVAPPVPQQLDLETEINSGTNTGIAS